jgi:3-isopropylmalate dehydrogenase
VNRYRLAAIPGDGVGREVTAEAIKALDAAAARYGFSIERTDYDLGGERYLATGEVLPESVQAELAGHDAILLGAVGAPGVQPGILERGLLLKLRFDFDLYVNLRPVKLFPGVPSPIAGLTPERCDMVIVRENTEGPYAGSGGSFKAGTPHEIAIQESINTRHGVERVLRYGYEIAQGRRRHLTVCHKTNVLNYAGEMWWRIAQELNSDYPDVNTEYVHADAACLYLVNTPERFDVIVTDNLFGDIITDLGAAVQGGLGLAASGNLNPAGEYPSMFEPVHGSAPDIAGRGWANPVAAVLSAALCLDQLGQTEAADSLEQAAAGVLLELKTMGGPDMGMATEQIGDRIAELIGT